jgi:hypothetical protein
MIALSVAPSRSVNLAKSLTKNSFLNRGFTRFSCNFREVPGKWAFLLKRFKGSLGAKRTIVLAMPKNCYGDALPWTVNQ